MTGVAVSISVGKPILINDSLIYLRFGCVGHQVGGSAPVMSWCHYRSGSVGQRRLYKLEQSNGKDFWQVLTH